MTNNKLAAIMSVLSLFGAASYVIAGEYFSAAGMVGCSMMMAWLSSEG